MTKNIKRTRSIREKVVRGKQYPILEALTFAKEGATAKFDETIDVAINLGIDAQKTDQAVRGSTLLPHGSGQKVSVAVFAQGANAEAAKKAGADTVGYEDLAESMKAGNLDYDVVIATPDAMRLLGQLGQVLGPKGLMPNPKLGTVTHDIATAVKNAKAGQVRFRTDKAGVVHCTIGKASFSVENLKGNLDALLSDIKKAKPTNTKGMGVYIKKITVSSTMGPGVIVDQTSF